MSDDRPQSGHLDAQDESPPPAKTDPATTENQLVNTEDPALDTGRANRERKLTDKGKAYHLQKREKAFAEAVSKWKKSIYTTDPDEDSIKEALSIVEHAHHELKELVDTDASNKCDVIMNRVQDKSKEVLAEIQTVYSVEAKFSALVKGQYSGCSHSDTSSSVRHLVRVSLTYSRCRQQLEGDLGLFFANSLKVVV
jgi:hypothetical protein